MKEITVAQFKDDVFSRLFNIIDLAHQTPLHEDILVNSQIWSAVNELEIYLNDARIKDARAIWQRIFSKAISLKTWECTNLRSYYLIKGKTHGKRYANE